MGSKYMIRAFNYPYTGCTKCKQTQWFFIALFWLIILMVKYDGVDFTKRK